MMNSEFAAIPHAPRALLRRLLCILQCYGPSIAEQHWSNSSRLMGTHRDSGTDPAAWYQLSIKTAEREISAYIRPEPGEFRQTAPAPHEGKIVPVTADAGYLLPFAELCDAIAILCRHDTQAGPALAVLENLSSQLHAGVNYSEAGLALLRQGSRALMEGRFSGDALFEHCVIPGEVSIFHCSNAILFLRLQGTVRLAVRQDWVSEPVAAMAAYLRQLPPEKSSHAKSLLLENGKKLMQAGRDNVNHALAAHTLTRHGEWLMIAFHNFVAAYTISYQLETLDPALLPDLGYTSIMAEEACVCCFSGLVFSLFFLLMSPDVIHAHLTDLLALPRHEQFFFLSSPIHSGFPTAFAESLLALAKVRSGGAAGVKGIATLERLYHEFAANVSADEDAEFDRHWLAYALMKSQNAP